MAPCGPYSMLELACQGAQRGLDFVSVLRVCALASGARGCCWRACVHACVRVCIPVALVCVRERKQMATRASHACTLVQPGPCSAPGPDVARAGALLSSRMCARFCVHAWARARVGLRVRVQVWLHACCTPARSSRSGRAGVVRVAHACGWGAVVRVGDLGCSPASGLCAAALGCVACHACRSRRRARPPSYLVVSQALIRKLEKLCNFFRKHLLGLKPHLFEQSRTPTVHFALQDPDENPNGRRISNFVLRYLTRLSHTP